MNSPGSSASTAVSSRDGELGLRPRGGHAAIEPRQEPDAVLGVAQRGARRPRDAPSARVAERAQPLGCLRHRPLRRRARASATQRRFEPCRPNRPTRAGSSRARFVVSDGILLQVVQLGARSLDELEPGRAPGVQRGPSQLQLGVERLGVGRRVRHLAPIGGRPERAPIDVAARRKPGIVERASATRRSSARRSGTRARRRCRGPAMTQGTRSVAS